MGIVILFIANRFLYLCADVGSAHDHFVISICWSDRKLFGDQIVSVVSTVFGEDRAGSLKNLIMKDPLG